MNFYFKMYLKNAAVGALTGATIGAACGSGAGVAGVKQSYACKMQLDVDRNGVLADAAFAGCGVGILIGCAVGAVFYPAYEMIVNRGCSRVSDVMQEIIGGDNNPPNREPARLGA
jgi:hypothetical protein